MQSLHETLKSIGKAVNRVQTAMYPFTATMCYYYGTPHQKHIAWRKLKRMGKSVRNPALLTTKPHPHKQV